METVHSPGRTDHRGLAIAPLIERPSPSPAEIDALLAGNEIPIVEGSRCTFLFRGDVDGVRLRHWIFGLPSAEPFRRIPGTDLWYHVLELPEGSRVEYKLEVTEGRQTTWIEDPLNPRRAHDPFGANSVCHAEGYRVPGWTQPDADVPAGTLEERTFASEALEGTRRITIYRPARYRETRTYPLVIVHDGGDYLRYADLHHVLDNLIHRLEIPGLVAVLTHPEDRIDQYRGSEAHARYLTEELVPSLEDELPLIGAPAGRCLMGASLGAVASFSTAIRSPDYFGRLLLQSGSFAFSDIGDHERGPVFDPIVDMINRYRSDPFPVAEKVFVSCGRFESLIYENRSLVPLLERTGMDVRYVESLDGHNWENWRDRLRDGLSFLFPGPLWWVYE